MKNGFLASVAGVILLLSAQNVVAQQGPAAQTPVQVLSQYPDGGAALESQVQTLMNADRSNLAAIIAFARTATEDQRKAIARGLANVAKAYAASEPGFAAQIQRSVAAAGLPDFAKAYAEAAGDTGTAAAGGGGGGGGGPTAIGPPQGGSNSGAFVEGNNFAATSTSGLLTPGGLGSAGTTTTSTQNTVTPVSPN